MKETPLKLVRKTCKIIRRHHLWVHFHLQTAFPIGRWRYPELVLETFTEVERIVDTYAIGDFGYGEIFCQ